MQDCLQDGFNFENETWASMFIKQKKGSTEEVSNWIRYKLAQSLCADAVCDLVRKNLLIFQIAFMNIAFGK